MTAVVGQDVPATPSNLALAVPYVLNSYPYSTKAIGQNGTLQGL